ncbi:MAG: hypothetical protein RLZZ399_1879, partial [Verrucomicrobiota bacterium]|jgi:hypothetical protein
MPFEWLEYPNVRNPLNSAFREPHF